MTERGIQTSIAQCEQLLTSRHFEEKLAPVYVRAFGAAAMVQSKGNAQGNTPDGALPDLAAMVQANHRPELSAPNGVLFPDLAALWDVSDD